MTEIIFDFDNLLVKTNDFVKHHLAKTCRKLGVTCPSGEEIVALQRKNLAFEEMFNVWFGTENGPKVLVTYREDAMGTNYEATDGGIGFVETAKKEGIPMVIASNRVKALPERLIQAGYEPEWFLAIVECNPKKPTVGAYDEALGELPGKRVVIFGDHTDDYLACQGNLRSSFIAVTSGLMTAEEFEKAGVAKDKIWQKLEPQKLLTI